MPFVKEKHHIPTPTPAFLFVMHHFGYTQAQAQRVIGKGRLLVNGEPIASPGVTIEGDIELVLFRPKPRSTAPVFQNMDFMIFEKPSGVLVHPNKMETEYSMLDDIRALAGEHANAVHRIDMETSGLLVASKHKKAERFLKQAFESKDIKKSYLAWVDGEIREPFPVDRPIVKNSDYSNCKHKVFIDNDGKNAHTDFDPIYYDKELDATLLACYPVTGRTHQIRVHLFHVKHPILGDPIYGSSFEASNAYLEGELNVEERLFHTGASRLMLHANSLRFSYGAEYFIESRVDFFHEKRAICPKNKRLFNQNTL